MKKTFLFAIIGLISFAGASPSRAELSVQMTNKLMDSTQDIRASELTRMACADKQGIAALHAQIAQKIKVLNEEEKAIILQMEAAPEDGEFSFQKKNLKGHASRKGYEAVLLNQRLQFIDQAVTRCP